MRTAQGVTVAQVRFKTGFVQTDLSSKPKFGLYGIRQIRNQCKLNYVLTILTISKRKATKLNNLQDNKV